MASSTHDEWVDWLQGALRDHERDRSASGADRTREPLDASDPESKKNPSLPWTGANPELRPPAPPIPEIPRYELREPVGEGATAVVYRAWDRELKRPVALKILRNAHGLSPTGRERFRREAEVSAGLSHPNLVSVYDAGEVAGQRYLIMELVDGRPLSELLNDPTFDLAKKLSLLAKAARGIEAAHQRGIVHRDVKPSNILVSPAGEPKVADFGLAHLMNSEAGLTRTGSTLGTPLYMSPEQVEGRAKQVTPRTDVYALGAILYEMAAGHPPYRGETTIEIYKNISAGDHAPLGRANPRIPRDLESIVEKALSREPGRRYATAGELAEDLERHLKGQPVQARPVSRLERFWNRSKTKTPAILFAASLVILALWGGLLRTPKAPDLRAPGVLPLHGAPEYWVGPGGLDLNPGTRDLPFREVSRALEFVAAGSTVFLEDGLYRGGLTIRISGTEGKPVTLKALGSRAILAPTEGDTILVTHSSHIVLEGIRAFRAPKAAVRIEECDHVTVRGCVLADPGQAAIFSGDSSDLLFDGNECSGSGAVGIMHFRTGRALVMRRNRIHGNQLSGIQLDGEMIGDRERLIREVRIEENVLFDNGMKGGATINCGGMIESMIRNNLLYQNHATGIALYGREQGGGAPSKNNEVSNNTVDQAPDGRWCLNLIGDAGGNRVFNNILVTRHPARGSIKYFSPSDLAGLVCDFNLFTTNPHPFSTEDDRTVMALPEWQALGFDRHSLSVDRESLFRDAAGGDYHLRPGAPAIAAGTTRLHSTEAATRDLEETPRPQGAGVDAGCYTFRAP
jgi:serine/threonine-protein kinase